VAIIDLFSKRQKRLRGEVADVYIYDKIPDPLRVQIIHIWEDTLGNQAEEERGYNGVRGAYEFIVESLCREYGLFKLSDVGGYRNREHRMELFQFLLQEQQAEKVLDVVELSFRFIDYKTRDYYYLCRPDASKFADDAISELNTRFREHGIGFQYVDGEIIRVDSELIHAEVVKPALALLHAKEFDGAQAEFLKAHEHYRHGNGKEALAECLKSLESVMKVICAKRKWKHAPQATSSTLIQVCFDNGLIPPFWQSHFSALRSLLESGVPTARNRLGGHGQGGTVVEVPACLVAYVLHMTAASIVFLVEAEQHLK
jgi:AbiJ N-terminal domain 4